MMLSLAILSSLFFVIGSETIDAPDRIGVSGPISFNGTEFSLAWSQKPRDTYYVQEYLPAGEELESFNQMMAIHLFILDIKIEDAVRQKVQQLKNRQLTDKICQFEVTESPTGDEFIVDCIMGVSKDDQVSSVEFNVNRFKRVAIGSGKTGILVYAYSLRSYGDNVLHFLDTLTEVRATHLNAMIATTLPSIIVKSD